MKRFLPLLLIALAGCYSTHEGGCAKPAKAVPEIAPVRDNSTNPIPIRVVVDSFDKRIVTDAAGNKFLLEAIGNRYWVTPIDVQHYQLTK